VRAPGLKPKPIRYALRGAEAPLFHGTAGVPEFFSSLPRDGPGFMQSRALAVTEVTEWDGRMGSRRHRRIVQKETLHFRRNK
jgi:hypothetical protein